MKVNVEDLKVHAQQRTTIEFKEDIAGLDAVKPVLGELTLALNSYGVKVYGRVQTLLKLSCDRCLRPYFQSLSVDIDESLVWADEHPDQRERELLRDDFVEPLPRDGLLDVSDIVYQAITLATPTNRSCGSECPGLPPGATISPSGEKNRQDLIDPRWENLKTIFPKQEKEKN